MGFENSFGGREIRQGVAQGTPRGGGLPSSSPPTPPIEETCVKCLFSGYGDANIFGDVVVLRSVIRQRARCCGTSADGSETRRMMELERDWTGINAKRRKWIEQRRERRNESEGQRKLEQNHCGINADNSRQAKHEEVTRREEEQDATRREEEQVATRREDVTRVTMLQRREVHDDS
ncbi:hypothetical protein CEXT_580441 [Caerostris extrusa]|uniref:Uncharacterized protein n=1 Tax=Caerostris extrusa TaxID=172846 RepID=A0AAV4PMQ2_CAEEX|nr:hypothetical protein CEXT_580441 [Caerostris extrusa]